MRSEIKSAAIVLNGPSLDTEIKEDYIICADGGVNLAVGAFLPDAVVGDLDSASSMPNGCERVTCPTVKDYTDGERAVRYAKEKGFGRITVYGTEGGRSDHVYANYALLAFADGIGMEATAETKSCSVYFSGKDGREWFFRVKKGQTLSVLPFDGDIVLDKSVGLLYPYNNLTVTRTASGLGISNVATGEVVEFTVSKGRALIFLVK